MKNPGTNTQPVADNATNLPFTQIRKRDGRLVAFDAQNISSAILKAGRASGEFNEAVAEKLTIRVLSLAQMALSENIPTVEQIQDLVEEVLLSSSFKQTAKAYILYRDQHARNREMIQKADLDLMDSYLNRLDWEVRENSNMDYSLQGLNNYVSSKISRGCGIIVNVTPFEPGWEGKAVLEISNTTPLPAKVYAGEGLAQVLFFESDTACKTSYADRKGKYQNQSDITLPTT